MKFRKVIFTHPIAVFPSEHDYGSLMTEDNEQGRKVDSIEAAGHWLIVKRGEQTRAIPAAKVESADVLVETQQKAKPQGAAA